nr:hypothetical protein [Tanacetum cinerariifolium]
MLDHRSIAADHRSTVADHSGDRRSVVAVNDGHQWRTATGPPLTTTGPPLTVAGPPLTTTRQPVNG